MKALFFALPVLLLAGCGGNRAGENNAAALDQGEEQGSPEAADILRNAADGGANVQANRH